LATSSHGKAKRSQEPKPKETRRRSDIPWRGRGDRDVRGSIVRWRRGKKTPTLGAHETREVEWATRHNGNACPASIHQSVRECRETLGPPETTRSPRLRGVSTRRKSCIELGTHEVRVHVNRSGGRSRSDASRVFFAGRSQGLLVIRALARRNLEAPPDAGHEGRDGETVRGKAFTIKNVRAGSACGFRPKSSRYDGRRSRAFARPAFTGKAK